MSAGRLTPEKGIAFLVQTLKLREGGTPVDLDIFGFGPLEESIRASEVDLPELRIRFKGTLDYGPAFFETLRRYDALVLPTFTDEQPRILFDAYSQGLPAIVSLTEGVREYHRDGMHGTSFSVGNPQGLLAAIERFVSSPFGDMPANCIEVSRHLTHERMHILRAEAISRLLPKP